MAWLICKSCAAVPLEAAPGSCGALSTSPEEAKCVQTYERCHHAQRAEAVALKA